jgi:hypothetical protein
VFRSVILPSRPLVRCAWCGSFHVAGEWLRFEAIGRGQVRITHELLDRASHGICPRCFNAQLRLSEEHHRKGQPVDTC